MTWIYEVSSEGATRPAAEPDHGGDVYPECSAARTSCFQLGGGGLMEWASCSP